MRMNTTRGTHAVEPDNPAPCLPRLSPRAAVQIEREWVSILQIITLMDGSVGLVVTHACAHTPFTVLTVSDVPPPHSGSPPIQMVRNP